MSSDGDAPSWNDTSLPVKIIVVAIMVFVVGINLIVWCFICNPIHLISAFISTIRDIAVSIFTSITSTVRAAASSTSTTRVAPTSATRVAPTSAYIATIRLTASSARASSSNVRLNPQVLASLPTFMYSPTDHKNKQECAVCLMEFQEGEKGRFLPSCLHSFHAECVDMWLDSHSTCPLCRTTVEHVISEPPV